MPIPAIIHALVHGGAKLFAQKGAQKAAQKGAQTAAQKGAEKAVQKGATTAAQKGAESAAQKGTQNFAQKGLKSFGNMEKSRYNNVMKAKQGQKDDQGNEYPGLAAPPSFHKGGKVRKTGMAKVKKGEVVLTEKQAKELKKKKISVNAEGGKHSVSKSKAPNKKRIALKKA